MQPHGAYSFKETLFNSGCVNWFCVAHSHTLEEHSDISYGVGDDVHRASLHVGVVHSHDQPPDLHVRGSQVRHGFSMCSLPTLSLVV